MVDVVDVVVVWCDVLIMGMALWNVVMILKWEGFVFLGTAVFLK